MKHVAAALRFPVVLVRHHELLGAFVRRELRARIEGSILGRVWPIVQPAILFLIYYFVFSKILKIGFTDKLAPHGDALQGWRTTFYLVTGILPWTALSETLSRGTGVVLENANLIKKIAFPSELLVVSQVITYHVYFLFGFFILLAMEFGVNGALPIALVWALPILLVQMLFVTGLALFLSAANVFVRDVMQAVPILLTFWMFTTPVFYDLDAVDHALTVQVDQATHQVVALESSGTDQEALQSAREVLLSKEASLSDVRFGKQVMNYNPMAGMLGMWRSIFSYGVVAFPLTTFFNLLALSLAVLLLGYAYYLRCKGHFADEV